MRRRNISDGNWTTCFRSRWMRCSATGIASPASPMRKSGVRKDIRSAALSRSHQPLARAQITEQRMIERRGRVQEGVIDAVRREPLGQPRNVRLDQLAILAGESLGHDRNLLAAFEILER